MRYSVELILEKDTIPKNKNRMILSLLKNVLESYDKEHYLELYENISNNIKNFTFSVYMGNCKFLRNEILIPNKKVILNLSTYSEKDGLMFFNSFVSNKGKEFSYKDNVMTIKKVILKQETDISSCNTVTFRTLSPLVIRDHKGDNKKTWYHSLNTKEGQAIFIKNLRYQLIDVFGEKIKDEFQNISIQVSKDTKEVKVKNYDIAMLSNITELRISAEPYILEYFYKAGIGSKRASGFGMLDVVGRLVTI